MHAYTSINDLYTCQVSDVSLVKPANSSGFEIVIILTANGDLVPGFGDLHIFELELVPNDTFGINDNLKNMHKEFSFFLL